MSRDEELVDQLAKRVLDSFEKLEVLILLDGKSLAIDALVAGVNGEREEVRRAIDELQGDQVIEKDPIGYRVKMEGPWVDHVRALLALHQTDRMSVVTSMSKASVERLRLRAAQAFADAFVLRPTKEDKNG